MGIYMPCNWLRFIPECANERALGLSKHLQELSKPILVLSERALGLNERVPGLSKHAPWLSKHTFDLMQVRTWVKRA